MARSIQRASTCSSRLKYVCPNVVHLRIHPLFQFQKYYPLLAEHIRTCSTRPSVAFAEARRFQPSARHDWKDVNREMVRITLTPLARRL